MKKTLFVLVVTTAVVLAGCAYAFADTQTVNVTAKVNPKFVMTLANNTVAFGTLDPGSAAVASPTHPTITVKSNKSWTYSNVQSAITGDVGPTTFPFSDFLNDSGTLATGVHALGVLSDTRTFTLDLSADHAYDIPANSNLSATVTYSAVQN